MCSVKMESIYLCSCGRDVKSSTCTATQHYCKFLTQANLQIILEGDSDYELWTDLLAA